MPLRRLWSIRPSIRLPIPLFKPPTMPRCGDTSPIRLFCRSMAAALGIPFETMREHLRKIRRAGRISFKGHGRGAAVMTTIDAAGLLIAAAGSSFVKDSVETLDGFRNLQPIGSGKPMRGSVTQDLQPQVALENYLAETLQLLIDSKEKLPSAYRRPPHDPSPVGSIGLSLMSVVGAPTQRDIYRNGVS